MLKTPRLFPKDPEEYAVVYQFWVNNPNVRDDMQNPILQSIATLRHHSPGVAIHVIDYSDQVNDWEDFQERFRFSVIRQRCGLSNVSFRHQKMPAFGAVPVEDRIFMEHLSRPQDLWGHAHRIPERYIVYSDCDIFWNSSCVPDRKEADYLHCRDSNTGVFYFDKTSRRVEDFFHVWIGLSMLAAKNRRFRQRLYAESPNYTAIQDELVYIHIRLAFPEVYKNCVRSLGVLDNYHPRDYETDMDKIVCCRSLHLMLNTYGTQRGKVGWLLKEYHPIMEKAFMEEEIESMFKSVLEFPGRYDFRTIRDGIWKTTPDDRKEFKEFAGRLGILLDHVDT